MKNWILVSGLSLLSTACSLDVGGARVRVSMPSQSSTSLLALGGSAGLFNLGQPPAPATYSGFTCFGLNVTGEGVGKSPVCANSPMAGKLGGLAPFSGGTVDVRVPPGPNRKIQLFGAVTSDGSCPMLESMSPTSETGPSMSVFHLGETVTDVFEDKRVRIQAQYVDAASAIPILQDCGKPSEWPNPGWFSGSMGLGLDIGPYGPTAGAAALSGMPMINFTQGTGASQPEVVTLNGRQWLNLQDANRNMTTASVPMLDNPTTLAFFLVMRTQTTPVSGTFFQLNWAGSQKLELATDSGFGLVATGTSVSPDTESTAGLGSDQTVLIYGVWTPGVGTGMQLLVNGNVPVDVNMTVNSSGFSGATSTTYLGGPGSSSSVGLKIAELYVFNAQFNPDERMGLECHFKQKYGIPAVVNALCPF